MIYKKDYLLLNMDNLQNDSNSHKICSTSKVEECLNFSIEETQGINEIRIIPINSTNQLGNIENCPICFDTLEKFHKGKSLLCGHNFCRPCLIEYLNHGINLNKIKEINCAQEGCKEKYNDEYIKEAVGIDQYNKMIRFRKLNIVNMSKELRWCINPGCEKVLKILPDSKKILCECGMTICIQCNHEWHGNTSCKIVSIPLILIYFQFARLQNSGEKENFP